MFQHYLPLQWHQRMMGSIVWWGPSPYWELEMVSCHISSTLLPEIYSKIYHVVIISMTSLFSIISFSMTNLMLFPLMYMSITLQMLYHLPWPLWCFSSIFYSLIFMIFVYDHFYVFYDFHPLIFIISVYDHFDVLTTNFYSHSNDFITLFLYHSSVFIIFIFPMTNLIILSFYSGITDLIIFVISYDNVNGFFAILILSSTILMPL